MCREYFGFPSPLRAIFIFVRLYGRHSETLDLENFFGWVTLWRSKQVTAHYDAQLHWLLICLVVHILHVGSSLNVLAVSTCKIYLQMVSNLLQFVCSIKLNVTCSFNTVCSQLSMHDHKLLMTKVGNNAISVKCMNRVYNTNKSHKIFI
jgi:hypothetical protein